VVASVVADFSSLAAVRTMAAEIAEYRQLDVLINNAGVYMTSRVISPDGIEMTLAVNHIAHVLLTHLLLELLKDNAPSRIITVSSVAHTRGMIDMPNLQGEKSFESYGAYAQSKLANVLFTYELARRLEGSGVTVNCLHPGVIDTKLLRAGFPRIAGDSLPRGAETIVYLATSPEVAGVSGAYFISKKQQPSSLQSYDIRLQESLRVVSERLAGLS
jgi:NAD(P)-dependent dehydrogenase (short-subunit alcohol dehydrogenase family)